MFLGYDSLDDFFTSSKKSDQGSRALFSFVEKTILNLAEVIDQLDIKVTGFQQSINELNNKISVLETRGVSTAAPSPASSAPASSSSVPPPPSGIPAPPSGGASPPVPAAGSPGGLPPLTGVSTAASSSPPGLGGSAPGGAPPQPQRESPLAVQASLRNELAEAFKKIRANLDEGDR